MDVKDVDGREEAIVARAIELAGDITTLPEVTARIIEVVDDHDRGINELFEIIRRDPALSAKLLQVVNSAFYGLPGQVADVDRAITLLGLVQVKNLSIAASVGKMFAGRKDPALFDARELWRHCVGVGVAARELTIMSGDRVGASEAFLAGLIHDIGLLVERQAFPDGLVDVIRRANESRTESFLECEEQVLGATHQDFGKALTARWRFPRRLQYAVGFHHDPGALPEDARHLGTILYCADTVCCQEGIGLDLEARGQPLGDGHLELIGVTNEQITELRERLAGDVDDAEQVLGSAA